MLFTDARFFLFLAVVFATYYLPAVRRWQIPWLLASSLFFYAYNQPWLLLLLILSAAISIMSSDAVLKARTLRSKRFFAAAGVGCNLVVLGFFKYSGFLYTSLFGPNTNTGAFLIAIPLPIGISFYTFHGISLLVDMFRMGDAAVKPRRESQDVRFGRRALLYLTFFPQLIAGPIAKARDFFPQIHGHDFKDIDWVGACQALLIGYFLKSVVADNLQNQTFWMQFPYFVGLSSINLIALLFGYSMQIFADFAGYSLIAIGLAKLFGYNLPDNFRFPYISESFAEFWTRWHISLSSWLREYLYIPLGGNRNGRARTYLNLMVVMLLGGLWHGAAWSYALWGTWHGVALAGERMVSDTAFYRSRHILVRISRALLVFGFVSMAWLLFRLPRFRDVQAFLAAMASNRHMPVTWGGPLVIALYSLPVICYHLHYLIRREMPARAPSRWRPLVFGGLLTLIALDSGPRAAFIYFQF